MTKSQAEGQAPPPLETMSFLSSGLFMGHLGRGRAFILLQENANVKLLSDLRGLTVLEYEWPNSDLNELSAVGVACNKMRRAVRDLGIFAGNEKQLALFANEVQELGDKSEKLRSEVKQQEIGSPGHTSRPERDRDQMGDRLS